MAFKAVFFDLDGTLLDSARDFIAILQAMRSEAGLPPLADTLIRQSVSAGAAAMVSLALDMSTDDSRFEAYKQDFLQRYQANPCLHSRLFDGLPQLLTQLEARAIAWGVATNKPEHFARPALAQLQLLQRAATLVCPEQVKQPKPAPDMLVLACQQLNINPAQMLYVGDDRRDIDAARAAGVASMAVGYGYHHGNDDPRLWGADYFVATSTELAAAVLALLD
ncbi:MAG: HAD-IA family hydrolase [Thiopseudomonas sp.]|nr:HAD-IA family hydrolase [Thiopseudomonas sp.]